ncbi:uncharacterized protein LOC122648416 [Telopea speciosissima]|uniref:uncharacterized protein LOC122648416 n=1 Tax=Telopea speciosissima TaxID=54955 RepID=UPI001CC3C22C|nr:uncharacterized protein LOC122648416 [Telopea speciosissima]
MVVENKILPLRGPRGVPTPGHLLFADKVFIFINGSLSLSGRVTRDRMMPLVDKFKLRLSSWKGKLLSFAGRVELVCSMMLSISVHNFSVYWWPASLVLMMERWVCNFIWSEDIEARRVLSVKWDSACKPKSEGGLGIHQLRDLNVALLCKLVRLIKHDDYLQQRCVISNGNSVKIWSDCWLGSESIVVASELGLDWFVDKSSLVADFISRSSWSLLQAALDGFAGLPPFNFLEDPSLFLGS